MGGGRPLVVRRSRGAPGWPPRLQAQHQGPSPVATILSAHMPALHLAPGAADVAGGPLRAWLTVTVLLAALSLEEPEPLTLQKFALNSCVPPSVSLDSRRIISAHLRLLLPPEEISFREKAEIGCAAHRQPLDKASRSADQTLVGPGRGRGCLQLQDESPGGPKSPPGHESRVSDSSPVTCCGPHPGRRAGALQASPPFAPAGSHTCPCTRVPFHGDVCVHLHTEPLSTLKGTHSGP